VAGSAARRHGGAGPALVLTFDNLGEASQLERGTWPAGAPLGQHPSVTEALPRLLDELDAQELTATFFVEGINCELYPDALLEIAARGHELGIHGWRHEDWGELSAERERDALARATAAFAGLGIEVRGFRPPGGALTERSPLLLREAGLSWCSPAGGRPGVRGELAYVPFRWQLVDAYHLMARFERLRAHRGDSAPPAPPAETLTRMRAELETAPQRTVVMHPFLMLDEAWFSGARELLTDIHTRALDGHSFVGPGGGFADRLRALAQPPQPILEAT
jgi:peptidoglycan/xylan/chitin deacetylase (PgdA/CDA1 family)